MLNQLKAETNKIFTENGAVTNKSTGNEVLNFFAVGGALRNRSEDDIVGLFTRAFADDALLAMKALFYIRDVRGGQGERRTFRTVLRYLANTHSDVVVKNIALIPEMGRWDDLYELFGTKSQKAAEELIKDQFAKDMSSDRPSVMAKWLASVNTSSKETRRLGRLTAKILGLSEKDYRKSLSALRAKIDVVERKMVSKKWEEIEYSRVPSKAGLNYRNAFMRHDGERYDKFIADALEGKAKINSKALYPYELVRQVIGENSWGYGHYVENEGALNAMWNQLPDYTGGSDENALAVVDTSASMTWEQKALALHVALSMGLYLAERNTGVYKNHFITFNTRPELLEVKGSTFCEKVRDIARAPVGGSTNVEGVFDLVLNTAVKHNVPQEDMVKRLYIISDMEFNQATAGRADITLMNNIKKKFEDKGYTMPELAFINVNARNTQFPMEMNDAGVALVSGMSPTIFEHLMKGEFVNPYKVMLDVLNSERYASVTV